MAEALGDVDERVVVTYVPNLRMSAAWRGSPKLSSWASASSRSA
jgi:hypothetical protein